jgi:predicted aldo/keto reductase-like oxidoreductase
VPAQIADQLKQREPERSIASWAFRYVGSFPRVLCALSGMTYMEHLQDNLESFLDFQPLDDEEKKFLLDMATQMEDYPLVKCTACNYCMPCPYGINIPAIFSHYNKCIKEGNLVNIEQDFSKLQGDPEYLRARRAFLIGYDRSVPRLRQADHCIGCGQCNPHCPQRINIPREMQKVNDYVEKLKNPNGTKREREAMEGAGS